MSRTIEQDAFVLEWLKANPPCVDCLTSDFHDAFARQFGGMVRNVNWGAATSMKAMASIKRLYSAGKLWRKRVGLGINWQPGFPKSVYSYYLPEGT